MKKRIVSTILVLVMLLTMCGTALAADKSRSYEFNLTANGSHEIWVKTGDEITVMLELKRTDSSADSQMYAMQDEINYDDKCLTFTEGSEQKYTGCNSSDISLKTDGRSHYLNFVSFSGGTKWPSTVTVGTFKMKVTATDKTVTKLENCNYLVSTANGQDTYRSSANDVVIHINSSNNGEEDVLNKCEHIAYVQGYPDGTVKPNASITRAETAQMLYRLLTDTAKAKYNTGKNSFSDIKAGAWYTTAVTTLSTMGIIKGYPDGTFKPNASITRAEFATMLSRFTGNKATNKVSFSDTASHWARGAIETAATNGWVQGYPNGTFRPNANITRAEAMTMINRMLGRQPEKASDLLRGMNTFTDNADTGKWYYLQIQEATNAHSYKMKSDNIHESWTALK